MKKNIIAVTLVLALAIGVVSITMQSQPLGAKEKNNEKTTTAEALEYVAYEFSDSKEFHTALEEELVKIIGEYRLSLGRENAGNVIDDVLVENTRLRALELDQYGLIGHKNKHFERKTSDLLFCKCENVSVFETKGQTYSIRDWGRIILAANVDNQIWLTLGAHTVCGVSVYGDNNEIYVAMNYASKIID